MSENANIPSGYGDDDALAAEYALGVLESGERVQASERVARDPDFARLVAGWEARLSGMNEAFAEVPPPPSVKARIDQDLFGTAETGASPEGFWSSLAFWKTLSGAALAGLALLAFLTFGMPSDPDPATGENLVAYLAPQDSSDRFVAVYDKATDRFQITQVSGERPANKDHELWLIEGDEKPISLGLVGREGEKAPSSIAPRLSEKFGEGVTLAVTLEPEGGAPGGVATGPVVALGPTKKF